MGLRMMFPGFLQRQNVAVVPVQPMALKAAARIALLLLPMWLPGAAFAAKHGSVAPRPIATIPVGPIGFRPPGEIYLLGRLSSTSLDFIDNTHLLFTFHESRLMHRDNASHDDQYIRAVVLDIKTGKAEETADWRMHDRLRYLLPTGNGTFLVRQGNSIEEADKTLQLHPYLKFKDRLFEMELSPDRQMLVTEMDLERHSQRVHDQLALQAQVNGESGPDEDVQLQMIRLEDKAVVAVAKSDNPVRLAVSSNGYIMHEQTKTQDLPERVSNEWKVYYVPFAGEKKLIARVYTDCTPTEQFLNEGTLLLTTCTGHSADRIGHALTLSGKEIWNGAWDARLVWPTYYLASSGSTFAIGWLRVSHPVDSFDPVNDSDVEGQTVQVLSTATGHLLMTTPASPVYSGGQNFALSADGKRLAVLNNGSIEVYEVPEDTK